VRNWFICPCVPFLKFRNWPPPSSDSASLCIDKSPPLSSRLRAAWPRQILNPTVSATCVVAVAWSLSGGVSAPQFARSIAHACCKVQVVSAENVQPYQSYQKPRSHTRRASDFIADPDSSNLQEFSPIWISIHRLFLQELLQCLHPTKRVPCNGLKME
jgi:hypothetical protein